MLKDWERDKIRPKNSKNSTNFEEARKRREIFLEKFANIIHKRIAENQSAENKKVKDRDRLR